MPELQPRPGAKGRTRWPRASVRRLAAFLRANGGAVEPTSRGHIRAIHLAPGAVAIFSGTPRCSETDIVAARTWLKKLETAPPPGSRQ